MIGVTVNAAAVVAGSVIGILFKKGINIVFSSSQLYFYRMHDSNTVKKYNLSMLSIFYGLFDQYLYIKKLSDISLLFLALDRIYWNLNYLFYLFYLNKINFPKSIFIFFKYLYITNTKPKSLNDLKKYFFLYLPKSYCKIKKNKIKKYEL